MPECKPSDQEKCTRSDRIDQRLRTANKVIYGSLALASIVYVSSYYGSRRSHAELTLIILKAIEDQANTASATT